MYRRCPDCGSERYELCSDRKPGRYRHRIVCETNEKNTIQKHVERYAAAVLIWNCTRVAQEQEESAVTRDARKMSVCCGRLLTQKEVSVMVRKETYEVAEKLGGEGKGKAYIYHIVNEEDLYGHGKMYAKIVLPPGSSVSWHQHVHETEPYYILSGEGLFTDNDKTVTKVHAGDICTILPGQCHSLENASDEDLVFIALIYND
jgi:quercetin dioxygenase-like cupin family protein